MRSARRSTIRLRLTLWYASAFFVAGAVLIGLLYLLLQQSLDHSPGDAMVNMVQRFLSERGLRSRTPVIDGLLGAITQQAEQQRQDTLQSMFWWSMVSLGATGVAACGVGWLLAGRALRPLQDITATARRVADHSLHERIGMAGPRDEIKDLADTFDAMLERLDRAFDGQRRFVANASHELRTPLAINRTLLEVALDDPEMPDSMRQLGATLLQVNSRHEHLIDGLLVLASSEQRLEHVAPVELAEVVAHSVRVAESAAIGASIAMGTEVAAVSVSGDAALLERIVQNLVDNAIRYNTRGGWVRVTLARVGGWARLSVENTGLLVAPSEVNSLFEPFRRLARPDRTAEHSQLAGTRGSGLGLSIVRSVTHAHGGDVRAAARPDGGLHVAVHLPLAHPSPHNSQTPPPSR
ncbi:sensor histidine kinase [Mycolicibacterium fluoranthenivorans]|uniref:histidine kinase n=1 Tax=Mycolicibacterium fluoranthenivorans TaxID=258505 RepID=A0A7X5ZAN6_9MYCO|nr:HAMP domain-containing sensor histidine kinase [Mycolicibacterium fluoranthenivorans]MCV7359113.1 HAMP domain-containing histidine kinase [Mycolicibacterium fluoranthenivorans]NIH93703.1 signal transduction histidine kinase [Mycolicibacterium fluoranthenivorans]